MSLKYGLNITKKAPASAPKRSTLLDDDDDDYDDDVDKGGQTKNAQVEEMTSSAGGAPKRPIANLANTLQQRTSIKKEANRSSAETPANEVSSGTLKAKNAPIDASIYDYDSFYDAKASVTEAKKEAARQDAIERKPKYINNLLDAAARRKQDQQVAKEKLLQKEREAEGDEFADKEKFVTGAYKEQQAENRRLEEEERKKAELEEKRKKQLGGGMQGLYRNMMDQTERQHREAMEAAARMKKDGGVKSHVEALEKSDAQLAAEMKARGVNVHLNEEGQVTDKRELLSAGLNIVPSGGSSKSQGADHLRSSNRPAHAAFQNRNEASQQAQRERQSKMMEEQFAAQAKRAREEEEEERVRAEKAARTTKTEKDVGDAKARYLARKAAKERGEG